MPDPNNMNFLQKFWIHIATALTGFGIIFRQKIWDLLKALLNRLLSDHKADLEAHEQRDVERFGEVKETILGVKGDVLDALRDNYKNIKQDMNENNQRTDKRLEFLEKVFLDSRLDKHG